MLHIKKWITRFKSFFKAEKGLFYTTIGTTGSSIIGGIFWFVLASLIDVESYGLTNYYISLAAIFSAIALIGMDATTITFLAKGETKVWHQANSLVLISGLITAVVLSVFQWTAGILSIAMVFFMMSLAEVLGQKKYKEYAFISVGQRIAQIALSLILYFPFGVLGLIIGYFLGNLLFSYKSLKSLPRFSLKIDSLREKRNYAIHSYGFNLIRNFTNNLDKIVIAPIFGYYVLGLYQLGFQFFMFLSIIPLSLYYYLLPEESSGKNKKIIKILGFATSIIAAIAVYLAVPYLIHRLFPAFIDSTEIVRIMSIAVIPSTVSAIFNATLLGGGESRTVLTAGLIYIISLVILLITLGQTIGTIGMAVTLVIAQTIQATYLLSKGYLFAKKATSMHILKSQN